MKEAHIEEDLSIWLSTYGMITAERVLERYKIRLQPEELLAAIKNPNSIYHRLLRVPLKNVYNGIILQQANDYQVYAQKLFIDYLMSGESGKAEDAPGGPTREDLESERKTLVRMADDFHDCEAQHNKLIAECQQSLMHYAAEWQKILAKGASKIQTELQFHGLDNDQKLIMQLLQVLLTHADLSTEINLQDALWLRGEKIMGEKLSPEVKQIFINQLTRLNEYTAEIDPTLTNFINQINEMGVSVRTWRSDFYNLILRVNDLIKLLPEYQYDPTQNEENRESLYFDADIGKE